MEKYVTNIKDLVIQVLKNGSEIKAKADSGDALSCFHMGMIHLLGIDTRIDFKKAGKYFENPLLCDNPDANRILGFMAECDGYYVQAFQYYANASKDNPSLYIKVLKERENLQSYFKKLNLPNQVLNNEITNVLKKYIDGGDSAIDSKIKLAYICEDEQTCLDAARAVYDSGNLFPAFNLLKKGKVDASNPLLISIKNKESNFDQLSNLLTQPIEVIELEGNSILTNYDLVSSYAGIKTICNEASTLCKKEWMDSVGKITNSIKSKYEKEEDARIKKTKAEEEARIKKQKAAELKAQAEEEARKKKRNIIIKEIAIPVILFIFGRILFGDAVTALGFTVFFLFLYYSHKIYKWIVKR